MRFSPKNMALATILIVDDEEKLRHLLARILRTEGFEAIEAPDCRTAIKRLEQHAVDVVLCDVKLPDGNGVDFTATVKSRFPSVEIILLTAYGNIPDGVLAIKNGAFDYLTKGNDNERIIPLLHRALEKVHLQKRVAALEKQVGQQHSFQRIIGSSKILRQAITLAQKVAPTDAPVLLTGETGSGKEVFAQAIHRDSPRGERAFVAVNCSTFSREILESELFGHRQGAFTGAIKDQKGLLEEANGGTLFLDEIGEMPLDLQAKLLRVLETGEFLKIGDTRPTKTNFRLLAATNRDLKKESEAGRFRADLFFRLNVFAIELPPLRDRRGDIEPLARFFAEVFAKKMNRPPLALPPQYLQKLEAHSWPGNIRELKNVLERSVILADGPELTPDSLPIELQVAARADDGSVSAFDLASVEKLHILKVLNYTQGNKTEAARLLNIGLTTLYRKLEEY